MSKKVTHNAVYRALATIVSACFGASIVSALPYVLADRFLEPVLYDFAPFRLWTLESFVTSVLFMIFVGVLVSLPAATTLGLAWHTLAHAKGWRSAAMYWILGLLAGATFIAAVMLWREGEITEPAYLRIAWGASLGSLTGLFAWLIRRPDRDAPNPATPAP